MSQQAFEADGVFFDGRSSQAQQVRFHVTASVVTVSASTGRELLRQRLSRCRLTPPLGGSRRYLEFPGGERLQVDDEATLAFLDEELRSHLGLQFVHLFESHWRLVAASLIGLVFFVWAFMVFAIPQFAKNIAQAAPAGIMDKVSSDSLELLDQRFFAPSELDKNRQQEIGQLFSMLCDEFAPAHQCKLVFRKGQAIGANAFALPSGLVIVTDELVAFAKNNEELAGVLAHELVHVKENHGLRHVLQQAGVFLVVSTLLGDMTSLTSLGSTLPMMLVESGYSRNFEREADELACLYFLNQGMSVQPYKEMLFRLTRDQHLPAVATFLASHPDPDKRLAYIDQVERSFRR